MKTPFYLNPDTLEQRWLCKNDFTIALVFLGMMLLAASAYVITDRPNFSLAAKTGISLSYGGLICGMFFHLSKQIQKTDEFAKNIVTKAIAQSGLFIVSLLPVITLLDRTGMLSMDQMSLPLAVAIQAPVLFLFHTYLSMRVYTRKYNK